MFTALYVIISAHVGISDENGIAAAAIQLQDYEGLIAAIIIVLVTILVIAGVAALRSILGNNEVKKVTGIDELDKAIQSAGYSYDPKQDIFYSNMDAWQRDMGYCHLYDEAAAPLGMIIDCEPIHFEYNGKRWLIELWKGQYDLNTGCEIGVYSTEAPDINIPGVFKGPFFNSASDADMLQMSYSLKKNGKILFTRKDTHWWLTGFKLGEFSEPWELTMDINITLKDMAMRNAFIKGLKEAGYSENEVLINQNTIRLRFDKTRTQQPSTRTPETDRIIQKKNYLLCDKYQSITEPYDNFPDKIKAIQEKAPELFKEIMNIGKTKQLFKNYKTIKEYLK